VRIHSFELMSNRSFEKIAAEDPVGMPKCAKNQRRGRRKPLILFHFKIFMTMTTTMARKKDHLQVTIRMEILS